MMEDLKHRWEQIDEDDYVAKYADMMLRVEMMKEQQWWWAVYRGEEELCPEKPFARNKEYAMKMAEECASENFEPYVSDDFMIGPNGAFEWTDDMEEDIRDWDVTLMDGLEDDDTNNEEW